MKRFEQLYYEHGLKTFQNNDFSTKEAVSGSILGNPFVLLKNIVHSFVDHTYSGSITITWEEYYTDSQGRRCSRTRSQTLTAYYTAKKAVYEDDISLIFANNVASNLKFKRSPGNIQKLSESNLKKKLKKEEKNLRNREQNSLKNGGNFVSLSNTEFEILFNALSKRRSKKCFLLIILASA